MNILKKSSLIFLLMSLPLGVVVAGDCPAARHMSIQDAAYSCQPGETNLPFAMFKKPECILEPYDKRYLECRYQLMPFANDDTVLRLSCEGGHWKEVDVPHSYACVEGVAP